MKKFTRDIPLPSSNDMLSNGPVKPIYTSNRNRYRAYKDSLAAFNSTELASSLVRKANIKNVSESYDMSNKIRKIQNFESKGLKRTGFKVEHAAKNAGTAYHPSFFIDTYKKPVQPVIYKKPEKKVTKTKEIVKAKPVEKVTMKPITEEKANSLRTGKNFKSKDSHYNNLVKKLGRKPTVAEYNKSIKK